MRPENRAAGELTSTEGTSNKAVELLEDEKLVLNLLKEKSPIDLNDLKDQSGLSNKKWDIAIRGLHKHNLLKLENSDSGLLVSLK